MTKEELAEQIDDALDFGLADAGAIAEWFMGRFPQLGSICACKNDFTDGTAYCQNCGGKR